MDQHATRENQVKPSITERDIKCRALDEIDIRTVPFPHLHGIVLQFNTVKVLERHLLEGPQLHTNVGPHFKDLDLTA